MYILIIEREKERERENTTAIQVVDLSFEDEAILVILYERRVILVNVSARVPSARATL